ncbi:hypothetical protein ACSTD8_21925, partial [Vibrio vulnificus]
MRCVWCLRWYAAAAVLRCSHLNRALGKSKEFEMKLTCHCENVTLILSEIPTEVGECNCSICRRYA